MRNGTEIHNIVKDVPKEAWPQGEWSWIDTTLLEQAFVGSMMKHQIDVNGTMPRRISSGYELYTATGRYGVYPTLLEALAAALKESTTPKEEVKA